MRNYLFFKSGEPYHRRHKTREQKLPTKSIIKLDTIIMRDKILPVPMSWGALGNSATAARLPLEQVVMVRIHVPQPN